jgi:large subunit ribosomal protein L23
VPLAFNKLDIRDYLLHAYGVRSVSVRSHVAQRPPRISSFTGRIGRPPPIKYMTVELERPFVWPAAPDAEEAKQWHSDALQRRVQLEKEFQARRDAYQRKGDIQSPAHARVSEDRRLLAAQAEALLAGRVQWDNQRELDPRWKKEGKVEGERTESK